MNERLMQAVMVNHRLELYSRLLVITLPAEFRLTKLNVP